LLGSSEACLYTFFSTFPYTVGFQFFLFLLNRCLPIQKAIQEAWEKQKIEMPKMPTIEEEEEEED